jgi:hypothetical protein
MNDYPDSKEELFARIVSDATNGGPQGIPVTFLNSYFDSPAFAKHGEMHPVLGDLEALAFAIENKWNAEEGVNLVAGLIRYRLENLPAVDAGASEDMDMDSEDSEGSDTRSYSSR